MMTRRRVEMLKQTPSLGTHNCYMELKHSMGIYILPRGISRFEYLISRILGGKLGWMCEKLL